MRTNLFIFLIFTLTLLTTQAGNACDTYKFAKAHAIELATCNSDQTVMADQIHLVTYSIGNIYTAKAFYFCSGEGYSLEFKVIDDGNDCRATTVMAMSTERIK